MYLIGLVKLISNFCMFMRMIWFLWFMNVILNGVFNSYINVVESVISLVWCCIWIICNGLLIFWCFEG